MNVLMYCNYNYKTSLSRFGPEEYIYKRFAWGWCDNHGKSIILSKVSFLMLEREKSNSIRLAVVNSYVCLGNRVQRLG